MKKTQTIFRLFALLFTMIGISAFGQQQSQYTMYMMNNYTLNPAVGGTENYADIKASIRRQWVGFDGSPTNLYLSGHTSIGKINYEDESIKKLPFHGVGGFIYRDQVGPNSKIGAYGSYAYHLPLTTKLTASFGTFIGLQNLAIDESDLSFHDDQVGIEDPTVSGSLSQTKLDASLGTWLYHEDYYIGLSLFQLFGNELNWGESANTQQEGQLSRHGFITAGYRIPLTDDLTLVPSILLKAVTPAPLQFDVNAKLRYKDQFWGGVSYRKRDAVAVLLGATILDHWDIGYSYDFTTSELNSTSKGSHEFLIGYRFFNLNEVKPTSQFW